LAGCNAHTQNVFRMVTLPSTPPIAGQRALMAIVFTDVVGFSAHMQKHEETTLQMLRQDFDTMRELCRQHEGSVLKTTGDGLLMHFVSAVQAVACALAIQRTFAEQARERFPEPNLLHRVGVHLGDVFVDKEDLFGEGVNIAARLQAEAEPGGICISQTVYQVVRNKLALQATRLGPRGLKNMTQTMPIYRLVLAELPLGAPAGGRDPAGSHTTPPMPVPARQSRRWLVFVVLFLLLMAAAFWIQVWSGRHQVQVRAEREQQALDALMAGDAGAPPHELVLRTLADWRAELRTRRSRALEAYDFAALERTLRDSGAPAAGSPEAVVREQTIRHMRELFDWLPTHLQKYHRDAPLVVRELTGTAPKQIKVYAGTDRRLYTTEGGATRQRDWTELKPTALAAIVAGAISQAEPLPPRAVVQGARAFADLYNLPELPAALKRDRAGHFRP
jgi:class 3 adenylate cyclase